MDKQSLALLIPILAISIPLAAIVITGLVKIARYRALGRGEGAAGDMDHRLHALEDEVHALRQELGEAQERLDFAERLLTRGAHPGQDG